jgi:hypothetical protein
MQYVPMCVYCGEKKVQIVVNSVGAGYCSAECERLTDLEDQYNEEMDGWRYEDIMSMYDDDPSPYAGTYSEE